MPLGGALIHSFIHRLKHLIHSEEHDYSCSSTDFGGLRLFHFCQLGGGRRRWLQTISVECGAGCIKEAERKEKLQASDSCVELSSQIIITFYYYYYYYYCLKKLSFKKTN